MEYLTVSTNVSRYQTHHRWQFFVQEYSAQVHCVCNTIPVEWNMWFLCFGVLPGSAEAQVTWGGIVKRLLIAYFLSNISAKKCQNPFICVKVISCQRWDVFETRCRGTICQVLQEAAGWLLPRYGPVSKLTLLWSIIYKYKYKYKYVHIQQQLPTV